MYCTLTSSDIREISSRSPVEAKVYRTIDSFHRQKVDQFADNFLKVILNEPYLYLRDKDWKRQFSIPEKADSLETICRIYDSLRAVIKREVTLQPCLKLENFQGLCSLYYQDLKRREFNFRKEITRALLNSNIKYKSKLRVDKDYPLPAIPKFLIYRLAREAKQNGWGEVLWTASALANYWEAIPFLLKYQVFEGSISKLLEPILEQLTDDWCNAFDSEMEMQQASDESSVHSYSTLITPSQKNSLNSIDQRESKRLHSICNELAQFALFECQNPVQDKILWQIGRYTRRELDMSSLAQELVQIARMYGWGESFWRASASTDYWEAIPHLLATVPIPKSDEDDLLQRAAQSRSDDWIRVYQQHRQGV